MAPKKRRREEGGDPPAANSASGAHAVAGENKAQEQVSYESVSLYVASESAAGSKPVVQRQA